MCSSPGHTPQPVFLFEGRELLCQIQMERFMLRNAELFFLQCFQCKNVLYMSMACITCSMCVACAHVACAYIACAHVACAYVACV